jgi:DNA mismatch repair protein MSH4
MCSKYNFSAGIRLAEVSTLPISVIADAKRISQQLAEQKRSNKREDEESKVHKAVFKLATRLVQAARNSRLDEETLRRYLSGLKAQYLKDTEYTEE